MPKPSNAVLVALNHPEFGQLIVEESTVPAYKKKGWTVEGDEVAPPEQPKAPSSLDCTVDEAAAVIATLGSMADVEAYVAGDERKTVEKAVAALREDLAGDE